MRFQHHTKKEINFVLITHSSGILVFIIAKENIVQILTLKIQAARYALFFKTLLRHLKKRVFLSIYKKTSSLRMR